MEITPGPSPKNNLSRRDVLNLILNVGGGYGLTRIFGEFDLVKKAFSALDSSVVKTIEQSDTIHEITVNSSNFQDVLKFLEKSPKDFSFKLSLAPGKYQLPDWSEQMSIVVKGKGFSKSKLREHSFLSGRKSITIESQDEESPALINFDGEIGMHFKDCRTVKLKNINISGGLPRKKEDKIEDNVDPLRSQILFEGVREAIIENCKFEGSSLPDGYEPDGIASIRGVTAVNKYLPVKLKITNSSFKNNAWDSVLTMGDVRTEIAVM